MRKAETEGLMCTSCGQNSVIQIEMKLPDGTQVVFFSCHECEAKWWDKEGEEVPIEKIIDLVNE